MTIILDNVAMKKLGRHLLKGVSFGLFLFAITRLSSQLAVVDVVDQLSESGVIKVPDTSVDQIGFDITSPAYCPEEDDEEEEEEDSCKKACCKHKIGF